MILFIAGNRLLDSGAQCCCESFCTGSINIKGPNLAWFASQFGKHISLCSHNSVVRNFQCDYASALIFSNKLDLLVRLHQ